MVLGIIFFFCLKLVNNFFVIYYFTKTLLVYFALINKFIEFREKWARRANSDTERENCEKKIPHRILSKQKEFS